LNKRDGSITISAFMARAARDSNGAPPPRGIVRAPSPDGLLDGRRVLPGAALAPYVHHFWFVRWSLRTPFSAEALQHPSAQITFVSEAGGRRAEITGVHTGRLARTLAGEGATFGITFRAAMFHPLLRGSMASITDRVVALEEVLGAKAMAWTRAIDDDLALERAMASTEAFLGPLLPRPNPKLTRLRDLVEQIASDRSIVRVEDVCAMSGLDVRALQRSFRTYLGVSPKWVIQRFRSHEALAQLAGARPPPIAALAASLGYSDQAHFTREFKRTVGVPPLSFARAQRAGLPSAEVALSGSSADDDRPAAPG
jgi:AraC-like DNA-binding protein